MFLPIYLGLCRANGLDQGHERFGVLINADLGMAVRVSVVHTVAMIATRGRKGVGVGVPWPTKLVLFPIAQLARFTPPGVLPPASHSDSCGTGFADRSVV